ncbi:hypothetical protein LCM4577_28445 [Mesorhizobium sp. LCM 4577]|nr:hypothetical protein LCM4577_28445 [Mesorhizobium sp. LCM 4577]
MRVYGRFCLMRGIAGDGDVENIAGKRMRPRADRNLSGRGRGIDMDADRRVDIVQQPFRDDPAAAERFRLFGGLEDDPVGRSKSPRYGHLKLPHLMITGSAAEQR